MLIFSRKMGEAVVIPGIATEVSIVAISGGYVRIGISAPSTVSIRRESAGAPRIEPQRLAE